jgi:Flp pilus assembly protein TadG
VSDRCDDGSAVVEFVFLSVLLLVPLLYVVMTGIAVQRSAFGLAAAARDAARAYATAGSDRLGEARAEAAVRLALRDEGVAWRPSGRVVTCGPCDYSPGSTFTVEMQARVPLPLVPSWMCRGRCVAAIDVSAHHSERISCYSGTGVPDPSCE